ncbi:glycine cleavage system protein H, partial [Bacillus amyloliquefaciens]|nr:glycine cleavage system protein H [Bacillus amyloliquefaciens]
LDDSPEFVNESPYEKAWMIVVEPADAEEIENLMTSEQYDEMTQED